jgi:hypothetical protein
VIVRVLEDGQYELDETNSATLLKLDGVLGDALHDGDPDTFAAALAAVIDTVRSSGRRLDPARIVPSDLALPRPGATIDEVRALLESDPDVPESKPND